MRYPSDTPPQDDRHSQLERALIEEYLLSHHHTLFSIRELAADQAASLLKAASLYASGRLCEVESRAHLIAELHLGHEPQTVEPHALAERDAIAAIPEMPSPPPRAEGRESEPPRPRRPLKWLV